MKIVSLAVPESLQSIPTNQNSTPFPTNLPSNLDKAFWLPDIPPADLLFSAHPTWTWSLREQNPCNLILFGGSRGQHLPKLIQVTVWIFDLYRIYGIDFKYSTEFDGREVHTLGRRGPFSNKERREEVPFDSSTDNQVTFDIDGPGGERIRHLYVQNGRWGDLTGFRVRGLHLFESIIPFYPSFWSPLTNSVLYQLGPGVYVPSA